MPSEKNNNIGMLVMFGVPILILLSLTIQPIVAWKFGDDIALRAVTDNQVEQSEEDFVMLKYEIEKVPMNLFSKGLIADLETYHSAGLYKVYGKLESKGDIDVLVELTAEKPPSGIYLTGMLNQNSAGISGDETFYTVDFGLSTFHMPDKNVQVEDDLIKSDQWIAHVKVKNGFGVLKEVNGR